MTGRQLEELLARLYSDDGFARAVLADPEDAARAAGLDDEARALLASIDRVGLELATRAFAAKRRQRRSAR